MVSVSGEAAEQLVRDVALVDEDAAQVATQRLLIFPGPLELLLIDGAVPQQQLLELHPA